MSLFKNGTFTTDYHQPNWSVLEIILNALIVTFWFYTCMCLAGVRRFLVPVAMCGSVKGLVSAWSSSSVPGSRSPAVVFLSFSLSGSWSRAWRSSTTSTLASAVEPLSQFSGDWLKVHEVAEPSTCALTKLILSATCLSEVSNRWQITADRASIEPSVVHIIHSFLSIFFLSELDIYIANEMIS